MKHIPRLKAKKIDVGAGDVLEYDLQDPDIDIAIVTINGNYPKKGFVVNQEVKELLYVLSGEGNFANKEESVNLQAGDQVLIEKGEIFRYENCKDLVIVAACTPAWHPGQHKEVDE